MFEFVLPEPAAFLVESKLRGFETQLDYPRPPQKPNPVDLPQWLRNMPANSITEARYRELSGQYDLSALPYPTQSKIVELIDSTTGKGEFAESGIPGGGTYTARTFTCRLDSLGYRVTRFMVRGHTAFRGYAPSVNVPVVGIRTPQTPEDPAQRTALGPPNPGPVSATRCHRNQSLRSILRGRSDVRSLRQHPPELPFHSVDRTPPISM